MKKYFMVALSCFLYTSSLYAANTSAYDTSRCEGAPRDKAFLLVLNKGDKMPQAIVDCIHAAKLNGAVVSGLGAVENPEMAYFNRETKQYESRTHRGLFEILQLNGNVTLVKQKPFAHVHMTLANQDHQTLGGHLMTATVGVTAELLITPLEQMPVRQMVDEFGINLIKTH